MGTLTRRSGEADKKEGQNVKTVSVEKISELIVTYNENSTLCVEIAPSVVGGLQQHLGTTVVYDNNVNLRLSAWALHFPQR